MNFINFNDIGTFLLFLLFSFLLILSAIFVIISKNPIHSVLFLVLSFFNVAALLILLKVEFISIIFIIVYVGAIAVLFLFCVMMLNVKLVEISEIALRYLPLSGFLSLIFLLEIFYILFNFFNLGFINLNLNILINNNFMDWIELLNNNFTNIKVIGQLIYTYYFMIFIIASLILLVAMICSIVLTFNIRYGLRKQVISIQLLRNWNKTIYKLNINSIKFN